MILTPPPKFDDVERWGGLDASDLSLRRRNITDREIVELQEWFGLQGIRVVSCVCAHQPNVVDYHADLTDDQALGFVWRFRQLTE